MQETFTGQDGDDTPHFSRNEGNVLRVGLTGGIGAGKSAVARLLSAHGAVIVDADQLARDAVAPGSAGLEQIVEAFGAEILTADGALDRARLGALVFADETARNRLNAIVHPIVARLFQERADAAPDGSVVVHDVPLLAENNLAGHYRLVLVVEAPLPLRLERLAQRGMSEAQAMERIAAQATDDERRAIADVIIRNDGSLQQLQERVDALWRDRIEPLRATG